MKDDSNYYYRNIDNNYYLCHNNFSSVCLSNAITWLLSKALSLQSLSLVRLEDEAWPSRQMSCSLKHFLNPDGSLIPLVKYNDNNNYYLYHNNDNNNSSSYFCCCCFFNVIGSSYNYWCTSTLGSFVFALITLVQISALTLASVILCMSLLGQHLLAEGRWWQLSKLLRRTGSASAWKMEEVRWGHVRETPEMARGGSYLGQTRSRVRRIGCGGGIKERRCNRRRA